MAATPSHWKGERSAWGDIQSRMHPPHCPEQWPGRLRGTAVGGRLVTQARGQRMVGEQWMLAGGREVAGRMPGHVGGAKGPRSLLLLPPPQPRRLLLLGQSPTLVLAGAGLKLPELLEGGCHLALPSVW